MLSLSEFEELEKYTLTGAEETRSLAGKLYKTYFAERETSVLLLDGEMGMGKTTFTSGFTRIMEIDDFINSPTFNILNKYEGKRGTLYHYDFYRIGGAEEIWDMGLPEYWDSAPDSDRTPIIHVMEWWERAASILSDIRPLFLIKFDADTVDFEHTRHVAFYRLS